VIGLKNRG